eukprot:GDKH01003508.1.p2 GENE.GDKH01003508.1~~GDKH01003508.1.p2  ORF type:complete len:91 (+),score=1.01 GDKH01003508.1:80-352(+)
MSDDQPPAQAAPAPLPRRKSRRQTTMSSEELQGSIDRCRDKIMSTLDDHQSNQEQIKSLKVEFKTFRQRMQQISKEQQQAIYLGTSSLNK